MEICCFTGHREIPNDKIVALKIRLDETIDSLLAEGVTTFRAGGALGFDTLAALTVLAKREKEPSIRLELCLPCKDQTRGWDDRSVEIYNFILSRADKVTFLHESYTKSCMLERNRFMVDGSDVCVAYCKNPDSPRGGTSYTVRYAKKVNVRVINLI